MKFQYCFQMDRYSPYKASEGEREKLLRLELLLHERVIGQNEAVTIGVGCRITCRAGIKDRNRPIGSFLS